MLPDVKMNASDQKQKPCRDVLRIKVNCEKAFGLKISEKDEKRCDAEGQEGQQLSQALTSQVFKCFHGST